MDETVQICRGFSVAQWRRLNTRLTNQDGGNSEDQEAWRCAVEVFERRIHERFLSCIEALESADSKSDISIGDEAAADCSTLPLKNEAVVPGFAIIALCCLLAETLQSFRSKQEVLPTERERCSYPAGPCISAPRTTTVDAFKAFLMRPAFKGAFDDERIASSFVNGVRNGILHEAETRKWVIWRSEPENHIVAKKEKGYALNRSEFYRALRSDFIEYLRELQNPQSETLRSRFRKKMNDMIKES